MKESPDLKFSETSQLLFKTFGGFSTEPSRKKFRTRKTESLAIYLALHVGTLFTRDFLSNTFWGEDTHTTARQSLRMALSDIRTKIGALYIIADRDKVGFSEKYVTSDIHEFYDYLKRANSNITDEKLWRKKAHDLYNLGWLPEKDEEWFIATRAQLQGDANQNSLRLIELLEKNEELDLAIEINRKAIEHSELSEDLYIALMKLLIKSGKISQAIATFETLERRLDDLWGEPPSQLAIEVIQSAPRPYISSLRLNTYQGQGNLVGRQSEIDLILQTLVNPDQPNIVLLTGTGGSGKTSIARECSSLMSKDGVHSTFIDLTTATTKRAALELILTALQISNLDPAEAERSIAKRLKDSSELVILDNLEQLGTAGQEIIFAINSYCPQIKLIATSRLALSIEQSIRVQVKPLHIPKKNSSLDVIKDAESIQLFCINAKRANPNFELTKENSEAIINLCKKLDGLPLPIKLAAARSVVRTPSQILKSIKDSYDPIKSKTRDRHGNIQATVVWTLDLLTEEAKYAAFILSSYSGKFTEETASSLSQSSNIQLILEELTNASLLNSSLEGEVTQFWFYDTIQKTLTELRDQEGLKPVAISRLLDYCLWYYAETEKRKVPAWQKIRMHFSNFNNVSECLLFSATPETFSPAAASLAVQIQRIATYYDNQLISEILESYYQLPDSLVSAHQRASIACAIVQSISNSGQVERQQKLIEDALKLGANDEAITIEARYCLANVYKVTGDYQLAIEEMDWVLKRTDPNNHELMANRLYRQGLNYGCLNDRENSYELFCRALPYARKSQDINILIRLLFDLGSEYAHLKKADLAIRSFIEAEALCESVGSLKLEGLTRWQHGDALLDLKRPADALEQLKLSIKLVYEANFPAAEKWIFIKAAQAALACGDPNLAAMLLGKGVHVREFENRALAVYEQKYVEDISVQLTDQLGEDTFLKKSFEGQQKDWQALWQKFDQVQPV